MRPYVYLAAAVTVDGRIASKTGYSRLSCPVDLKRLHALRAKVDAVLVGAGTVKIDNPRLTVRYVEGRNPVRVIVDGSLSVPQSARVFDSSAPTIVLTTEKAPREKVAALRERGVEVIQFPGDAVPLREALERLYASGIRSVLVEGGGRINWQMLSQCLVDELVITVTPYAFGAGTSLLEGPGYDDVESAPFRLRLLSAEICECGQEVVLRYRVECKQ
ncbi:2, 5-diamino-6-hydroxy-4-(5-phosphoribosylamino)pyrimidine [Thermoproteus uzoniensis 768-20]|uniref:2,5-diamino-6-(ribosylamino)-4(3H)-pyrimidinone 5'-phosphate reductase n=1 Tax=Thermoproteus uzoniensis (strain 768-20) TaxID=999630 RepID=F2L4J0_THEU7|nr:2,5-diamino-6-(ribosylamino)-4(3H)-pyrimidinone 5'-phosphate reductase [Thermoproteus uzoniensis]AEA12168.1 2, 5-diamino-6-hydroxy-4-(5-phosphoribosylamino)pyrimidine [Thermoproteus uzoniensis 768-20]